MLAVTRRQVRLARCDVLEPSSMPASAHALASEAASYTATIHSPGRAPGDLVDGRRVEDLEALPFEDASFDLVLTQDVLEHVHDLEAALRAIARVLRPGGAHVFTIPIDLARAETRPRVRRGADGSIDYQEEPAYHGDPYDGGGALVITDFGADVVTLIEAVSGMPTELLHVPSSRGLRDPIVQVLVSRSP